MTVITFDQRAETGGYRVQSLIDVNALQTDTHARLATAPDACIE